MTDEVKTDRFLDFDKAFEELTPVTFQLEGKTYSLPPEMPISRLITITQISAEPSDPDHWTKLMVAYVGTEIWDEIKDKMGVKRLLAMVTWLNSVYMGPMAGVQGDAEADASGDGAASKEDPTSSTLTLSENAGS